MHISCNALCRGGRHAVPRSRHPNCVEPRHEDPLRELKVKHEDIFIYQPGAQICRSVSIAQPWSMIPHAS